MFRRWRLAECILAVFRGFFSAARFFSAFERAAIINFVLTFSQPTVKMHCCLRIREDVNRWRRRRLASRLGMPEVASLLGSSCLVTYAKPHIASRILT